MTPITILLVVIVALLAGMEGILDQWEFHQPLVACSLIGLVTGHPAEGIILGGSLQMIALGWANIGAAVAPDAALASVASAIIMVLALNGGDTDTTAAINTSIALAIPLSVAGLFLTMIARTIATGIVHAMDAAAEKGDFAAIERWHIVAIFMQGARIAVPAAALCFIDPAIVTDALNAMPKWLTGGMAVGGGMVAAVGYAMVINMMATREVWPLSLQLLTSLPLLLLASSVSALLFSTLVLKTLLSKAAVQVVDQAIHSVTSLITTNSEGV